MVSVVSNLFKHNMKDVFMFPFRWKTDNIENNAGHSLECGSLVIVKHLAPQHILKFSLRTTVMRICDEGNEQAKAAQTRGLTTVMSPCLPHPQIITQVRHLPNKENLKKAALKPLTAYKGNPAPQCHQVRCRSKLKVYLKYAKLCQKVFMFTSGGYLRYVCCSHFSHPFATCY